jgi:hypothetical protein
MAADTAVSFPPKCTVKNNTIIEPQARVRKLTPATPTARVCGRPMMNFSVPHWMARFTIHSPVPRYQPSIG